MDAKVTKRDFLKMLGIGAGATSVASRPSELPKDPEVCDLPTAKPGTRNVFSSSPFYDGDYSYVLDARDSILYDSVYFAPGEPLPDSFRLFQEPKGMRCQYSGKMKWDEDTNMQCLGIIPPPSSFWVKRIHVAVAPETAMSDVDAVRKYAWRFILCQKTYAEGPCILDLQCDSIPQILARKPRPIRSSMQFEHTKGLYIPSQMYFAHEFQTGSAEQLHAHSNGAGIRLIAALEGVEWRGIQ